CNRISSHKANWIKSLLKKGLKPIIKEIESCIDVDNACVVERSYIEKYSNLTNSTTGGETNKVYRKDVLEKMSKNRKGKCVGEDNPMYGVKRPDLSERNKVVNKDSVEKMRDKLKVLYNTEKYKNDILVNA